VAEEYTETFRIRRIRKQKIVKNKGAKAVLPEGPLSCPPAPTSQRNNQSKRRRGDKQARLDRKDSEIEGVRSRGNQEEYETEKILKCEGGQEESRRSAPKTRLAAKEWFSGGSELLGRSEGATNGTGGLCKLPRLKEWIPPACCPQALVTDPPEK